MDESEWIDNFIKLKKRNEIKYPDLQLFFFFFFFCSCLNTTVYNFVLPF